MRQIIRTVMPLNDGNIDSRGNFHNDDSVNAASEDVTDGAPPPRDRCETRRLDRRTDGRRATGDRRQISGNGSE